MNATLLHQDMSCAPQGMQSAASFAELASLVQSYLGCEAAVLKIDKDTLSSAAFRSGHPPVGADASTLANPLTAKALGMSFFVGMPLTDGEGHPVGMLAAMDVHQRGLAPEEFQTLKHFARIATDIYEMQRRGCAA